MLLASYPNSTPVDQSGYVGLLIETMVQFSPELVFKAVLPSGIPSEITTYLPSVGAVYKWLTNKADAIGSLNERLERRERQIAETEDWLRQSTIQMRAKAGAWLDRSDPASQEISGEKTNKVLSEEEKKALLDDAMKVGKEISTLRLRPETLKTAAVTGKSPSAD